MDREHRDRAWVAWTTASLTGFAVHQPQKMPRLETVLGDPVKIRAQSVDDLAEALKTWLKPQEA